MRTEKVQMRKVTPELVRGDNVTVVEKKHKCVGRESLIYNAKTPKARDAGVLTPLYPSRSIWRYRPSAV